MFFLTFRNEVFNLLLFLRLIVLAGLLLSQILIEMTSKFKDPFIFNFTRIVDEISRALHNLIVYNPLRINC